MKKVWLVILSIGLLFAQPVLAVCPVCTIAVGAGVGLAQWLGIDDTISGTWIGALTVSVIMWTINWMNKKNLRFKGRKILVTILYYIIIVLPLRYTKAIWHPYNTLYGVNRILLGIIVGSMVFFTAVLWYNNLKKKNHGRAYFPFQKVAMPVGALALTSLIFYFLTK